MRTLAAAALMAAAAACGDGDVPEGALDRDTFIEVWVELQAATAELPEAAQPAERARILGARGLTEDDLLEFVEVHGSDIAYMNDVWGEVLQRLEARGVGAEAGGVPLPRPDTGG